MNDNELYAVIIIAACIAFITICITIYNIVVKIFCYHILQNDDISLDDIRDYKKKMENKKL